MQRIVLSNNDKNEEQHNSIDMPTKPIDAAAAVLFGCLFTRNSRNLTSPMLKLSASTSFPFAVFHLAKWPPATADSVYW
jgi:hypothetical protein